MPPEITSDSRQVSVIGSSDASERELSQAREVGRLIGEREATLVCGGLGGVMDAACRGLQESGSGCAVGILPTSNKNQANPYVDVVIPTGMGSARNLAVVQSGDSVVAIGGSYGTLSELSFSLKFNKPVFGVGSWEHPELKYPAKLGPEEAVERAFEAMD